MGLDQQSCVPCRGGIPPLSRWEAEPMLKETPGWTMSKDDVWIERTFTFPDFKASMAFVTKVGALAEAEGHHPDITFGWGYAKVVLYTHKIQGLHQNDFILAAKINKLAPSA
jgi:4a-hydroxytetrahydrobiopterin dehydratase